jgi:hypothetical protein
VTGSSIEAFKFACECSCGSRAILRSRSEATHHDRLQRRRHLGCELAQWGEDPLFAFQQQLGKRVGAERCLSGQQLVEDDAEGVDVGRAGDGIAAGLFTVEQDDAEAAA